MHRQSDDILLDVRGLKKHFPILGGGVFRRPIGWIKAVDGIDFFIHKGETLGLVGESGCGKTTTGKCVLYLEEPTGGEIRFNSNGTWTDVSKRTISGLRREMQVIFQDPYSSLSPRMKVSDIVGEPPLRHRDSRIEVSGTNGSKLSLLL